MKNDIAFITIVYPECERFAGDFIESMQNQTCKNFDLVVINENVEPSTIDKLKQLDTNVKILNSLEAKPAQNRIQILKYVISEGYDKVVLGDFDDTFAENRIEKSADLLEEFEVVVNDLNLVDENLNLLNRYYFSNRLENMQIIGPDFIRDKNIFGLSNTAVRVKYLPKIDSTNILIAFDWLLFTKILHKKEVSAVFTNETYTGYRQHSNNFAGILTDNDQTIIQGIKAKLMHYNELSTEIPEFMSLVTNFQTLWNRLNNDHSFKKKYVETIQNSDLKTPLWWEKIQPLEDI